VTDVQTDTLTPFVIEHADIRGALVRLHETSRAILDCHDYPPAVRRALAELIAAAALLASTLKMKGSLVVQLSGDGPLRLLVVECNDALELRATAQWSQADIEALPRDASLSALAGDPANSRLVLTLDPRDAGAMYQGIVALEGESIAASLEHYLKTSEQLASRLVLSSSNARAAGIIVQRLPSSGRDEDAMWGRLIEQLGSAERLLDGDDVHATLHALFPADDVRVFDSRPVAFRCRCSRARAENALRIAGVDEIEAAIAERGDVEVACEFCNHRYTFTPAQARSLFAAEDTRH